MHDQSVTHKRGLSLSLNTKIAATATALVVASLALTGAVIGFKGSSAAEQSSMELARTAAREAGLALQSRIGANLAAVTNLGAAMRATRGTDQPLTRPQIGEMVKATLLGSADLIGSAVTFEPNALDGKDAEFARKKPEYDDSGRFMPYYTREAGGGVHVEPIVFEAPGSAGNAWYDVPKASGKLYLTEPYPYPINGKQVMIASLVAPIVTGGQFRGVASADFMLTRLGAIMAEMKVIDGGILSLVSNAGLYASHPNESLNGKKAEDIPAAGLDAVRQGRPYEYVDANGYVHLLQPLKLHDDIAPWAVQLTFPKSVATASARELLGYTTLVSVVCALLAAIVLVAVLYRLMAPLRRLAAAMTDLSSGHADLTVRLEVRGNDELSVISRGFNQFVAKIHDVLAQVRASSENVATASGEIRQGNADLSARTEQQASALEETAASMEELTGTVRQNADNARQANQLAVTASDIATRGGAVVGQVVQTMESINDSSRRIVDIISVIDGIAFQTNILALNAAVEAARAGEQGRGFAVVAGEVRSLAQRSAAAAKEIKELIDDSVEKVGSGTSLVSQAGRTMEDVVQSVRRVTDIVSEIAAASAEQSAGIGQVNQAIGQMDGVTQQNAALVEEAAAAAESLQAQAGVLVELVGQFKLADSATRMAPRAAAKVAAPRPGRTLPPARKAVQHAPARKDAEEWEAF